MDSFITVNGLRALTARLIVGNTGPWVIDFELAEPAGLAGRVRLQIQDRTFIGTVVEGGTFSLRSTYRIVAGGAGWGNLVQKKDYHNDAGVRARAVADDVARYVGETIGDFEPATERVGVDFVRSDFVAASTVLESVLDGTPWWVDYSGVTQCRKRGVIAVDTKAVQVLTFDPRERILSLGVEDPWAVLVGSVVSKDLEAPQTVASLELSISETGISLSAWCNASETVSDRLPGLLRAIADKAREGQLLAKYRYRVVRMASERVELQAVRKGAGLPDLLPVSMWPGVAGVHAELAPGAEVLVEFIEGDPAMPIVTHFAGKGGTGFVPVSLVLGGPSGPLAARQNDAVEVLLPPAVFSGTVGGSPASGVLTFVNSKALGIITGGSTKVRIAP